MENLKKISNKEKTIYLLTDKCQARLDDFLDKFIKDFEDEITRDIINHAVSIFLKNYLDEYPSLALAYDFRIAAVRQTEGLSFEVEINEKE